MKMANSTKTVSSLVLLMNLASTVYSKQLAFPTAEGYGKYAVGGRGGRVYEVADTQSLRAGQFG